MESERRGIFRNHPASNYLLLCVLSVSYAAQVIWDPEGRWIQPLILRHWAWPGLTGYVWVHTDLIHMLESLVTLWIAGRWVARRMSGPLYVTSFLTLGVVAATTHLLLDGRPTVGASGAIMGILGMHLVLCHGRCGLLEPSLIGLWLGMSLTMGIAHIGLAAHMAHVGGFLAGILLAWLWALTGRARTDEMHPALQDWLLGKEAIAALN